MNIALRSLTFLIPSVGIVGGLSLAPMIGLFLIFFLLALKSYSVIQTTQGRQFHLPRLAGYLFLLWCGVSILWSAQPAGSLILLSKLLILFMLCSSICCSEVSSKTIIELRNIIAPPLLYGMIAAIALFFIEYFTNGFITLTFRSAFQSAKEHSFGLHMLDRGCTFLSLISWVAIGWLLQNNKKFIALIIYCVTLYLLSISDSLSGFVSFILGSLAFIAILVSRKFIWLIMICMLATSVLLPITFNKMDPLEISEKFHQLPTSAKHRLFIWHFAAEKAYQSPMLGLGFNSSKSLGTDNDVIPYHNEQFSLLPLHPHNNILQVLLETGAIGLGLFMTMMCSLLAKISTEFKDAKAQAACFVSYFSVGMISFSLWQTWWVASGLFVVLMMTILLDRK